MMLTIIDIKNPRAIEPDLSAIKVSVRFEGEVLWSPFVARPTDQYGRGAEIFKRAVAGEFGEIVPYMPPHTVLAPAPASVTRAQGKAALIRAGKWNMVLAYVASIKSPTERALAEVAMNDTTEWLRTSPFLNAAADAIGLSQAQLDDLFREAAAIAL